MGGSFATLPKNRFLMISTQNRNLIPSENQSMAAWKVMLHHLPSRCLHLSKRVGKQKENPKQRDIKTRTSTTVIAQEQNLHYLHLPFVHCGTICKFFFSFLFYHTTWKSFYKTTTSWKSEHINFPPMLLLDLKTLLTFNNRHKISTSTNVTKALWH